MEFIGINWFMNGVIAFVDGMEENKPKSKAVKMNQSL